MRSINKVIIIGNLTRDPELRQTPNGQNVTTFGLATNRQWVTKENEKKNSAEFHECVAWAHLAEICSKYLKKGNLVYVEGYLKTRSWDSPEGIKKFKTEIVVQDMIMLEKKQNSEDYIPENEYRANTDEQEKVEKVVIAETPREEITPEKVEEVPTIEESVQVENIPNTTEESSEEVPPTSEDNPIDKDLGL